MLSVIDFDRIDNLKTQEERVYEAAKIYISNGMYVIPLVKNGKRLPDRKTGINYSRASKNLNIIEKWFHPTKGKYAGWNIGIACGKENGVFALDVDRNHNDVDGLEELHKLESEYGGIPTGPIQITPSGGRHYIFQWQENALSSTGKIGRSIDTRGGTSVSCKGHIVAYPSIVDGKQYRWQQGGPIPEIPPWVMMKLGNAWKNNGTGRGNENVGDGDVERIIPIDQIHDMLGFIDPDDLSYDEWLRIGMAIKSQYPDEKGLSIWDEWSRSGSRYVEGECSIRWDGFDPSGPVRAGTLYYHSKERGWEPSPDSIEGDTWDEIVERLNTEFALVMIGGKIKILREKTVSNRWEDPFDIVSKDDFKTLLENKTHAWIRPSDGKAVIRTEAEIWLAHQARREYPNGIGMYPNSNPEGVYNTWRGYSYKPKKGDVQLYLDHIKYVVCNGDDFLYNWVLDWVADLIQDPSNPKGCAIVMKGPEGAGKGSFVEPLGAIFGPHYVHLIDSNHLTGRFSGHFERAILVFADEVVWGGDKKAEGKLKGLVTEEIITTERKGIDAMSQRNFVHVIMASNNDWVIPAGTNSRRWFVVEVSDKKVGDFEYFSKLKKFVQSKEGISAILHYFSNRKITNNLRKAPETKALQDQRTLYVQFDPVIRWWTNCVQSEMINVPDELNNQQDVDWPALVDRMLLYNEFEDWCLRRNFRPPSASVFYKKMISFGCNQIRPQMAGVRKYKFEIPNIHKATMILSSMGIEIQEEDKTDE